MRRNPVRIDGKLTKDKIIKASYELFSSLNYNDVSVSKIVKKAGISTGAFYQYFSNKESLFKTIVQKILKDMAEFLKKDTVENVVETYINYALKNKKKVKVLHEAEFIHNWVSESYEMILRNVTEKFVSDDAGYVFFWGSLRFYVIYNILWKEQSVDNKDLVTFLKVGFGKPDYSVSPEVYDYKYTPVAIDLENTKLKLLISAEELFGRKGYSKTQISEITQNAGVAQGTFYIYYKRKKEILEELVMKTNRNLRLSVKLAVQKFENRIDAEIAGFYAFLKFFSHHINMYKIVRESEFVIQEKVLEYYEKIKTSYLLPLERAMEKQEIVKYDAHNLAVFLMGIGHFLGIELLLKRKANDADMIRFLIKLSKYITGGLEV
ncbi:TetR/AcrR family transcriptional regulator [Thermosipho ferrireducens]|uniref:TetR/AcrR family transcriptional regulator n=1 Tax=Thermosipho ferrireducens TaxID=2571116 RepID=A0ABX7S4N6_9BACT|nr:TetR/AcrR family transcriptional regulator [Thermosipho ferrireducens]QTA37434.1 TetR/AcrR family transcriptional regulator [Thermosipho ferrireducens]